MTTLGNASSLLGMLGTVSGLLYAMTRLRSGDPALQYLITGLATALWTGIRLCRGLQRTRSWRNWRDRSGDSQGEGSSSWAVGDGGSRRWLALYAAAGTMVFLFAFFGVAALFKVGLHFSEAKAAGSSGSDGTVNASRPPGDCVPGAIHPWHPWSLL